MRSRPRNRRRLPGLGYTGFMLLLVMSVAFAMSGCASDDKLTVEQGRLLEQMPLSSAGTKEVEGVFGTPTAVTESGEGDGAETSWAYAVERLGTRPLRYLPFLGALAVADVAEVEDPSFAVNFSAEGEVQGATQRKLGRYTILPGWPGSEQEVLPYGWRNLNARPSPDENESP